MRFLSFALAAAEATQALILRDNAAEFQALKFDCRNCERIPRAAEGVVADCGRDSCGLGPPAPQQFRL